MQPNSNDIINFIGKASRVIIFITLLAASLVAVGQTSFCPPNFKVLLDYTFESAVKKADPYKKYFPKPIIVNAE
ncbi:hypothetical protein AAIR98_000238 [Elusimicrobium simillimum]|uniref:hypothetical protein n=1 Tax=Elusimicrobium simillimum TaxID=3143438 RepID=UPI003C6FC8F6